MYSTHVVGLVLGSLYRIPVNAVFQRFRTEVPAQ